MISKINLIKIFIILFIVLISFFLIQTGVNNYLFSILSVLIILFFSGILLYSKDYLNPFIFFFLYSFLGFLDVVFIASGLRTPRTMYSMDIYIKTLFIMLLWFFSFSIGYFIYYKVKRKNDYIKPSNFKLNDTVMFLFLGVILAIVLYKFITSVRGVGGLYNAFFNDDFQIFDGQNYLSMLMALCGIIPVIFLRRKNIKMSIISIILVFLMISLTKRRSLALIYSLLPFLTYLNYCVKKIKLRYLALCIIPVIAYILYIGSIRGVSSGSSTSNNFIINSLCELTRQVEYGDNIPDVIYNLEIKNIDFQYFKYTFTGIITYIPRGLWPDKPIVESSSIISNMIYTNSSNVAGHPVGPYGWAFFTFGYFGVVFMGGITGFIASWLYNKVKTHKNLLYTLIYSYSIVKLLEIFTPEAQFKISFFIICILALSFVSSLFSLNRNDCINEGVQLIKCDGDYNENK